MRYSRAVSAQRFEPTAILAVVRRLHCGRPSIKPGATMKNPKKIQVKVGKRALSPPPTASSD